MAFIELLPSCRTQYRNFRWRLLACTPISFRWMIYDCFVMYISCKQSPASNICVLFHINNLVELDLKWNMRIEIGSLHAFGLLICCCYSFAIPFFISALFCQTDGSQRILNSIWNCKWHADKTNDNDNNKLITQSMTNIDTKLIKSPNGKWQQKNTHTHAKWNKNVLFNRCRKYGYKVSLMLSSGSNSSAMIELMMSSDHFKFCFSNYFVKNFILKWHHLYLIELMAPRFRSLLL